MSHARERDHGGRECRAKTGWWPRSRELRCSCSPQTTSTLWVWAGLGNRWSRFLEISRALKRACPSTSHWNLSHRHFQTRCIRDALAAGTPCRSLRSTPRESRRTTLEPRPWTPQASLSFGERRRNTADRLLLLRPSRSRRKGKALGLVLHQAAHAKQQHWL